MKELLSSWRDDDGNPPPEVAHAFGTYDLYTLPTPCVFPNEGALYSGQDTKLNEESYGNHNCEIEIR